jgi:exosortase
MNACEQPAAPTVPGRFVGLALGMTAALFTALIVSHWGTLAHMADRWAHDPQYSHGFVVPLFALVVLWSRNKMLTRTMWHPSWLGLPLMALGMILRIVAVESDLEPLDSLSLVPTGFGLVLLAGGWSVLRWSWPALAFLAFMMPLPFSVEMALAYPLRRLATEMSTYVLQTLGCPALAEGNIIFIDDIQMGVAEACSGLGMLMTFFALATAMALIGNVSLSNRLVLVASAIPIAILANVVRISATGVAYHLGGKESEFAKMIYHDLAGWLMMPLALGMFWLELKFLTNLWIDLPGAPLALSRPPTAGRRQPAAV